jgi:ribosomal protein S18 acetylase RimI-like enzyme
MAGDYAIREGGRDDMPALERVWRSLFAHHSEVNSSGMPLIPVDERWPERRRECERAFDAGTATLLVAERDGEVVGIAFSRLHDPDPVFDTGPMAELDVLAITPGHRGHGIGEALLRRTLAAMRAQGVETIKVAVMAGNDEALRFYERFGIRPALLELLAPLDPA